MSIRPRTVSIVLPAMHGVYWKAVFSYNIVLYMHQPNKELFFSLKNSLEKSLGGIECDVGDEEGRLLEAHHTVHVGHHHPHLQVELEEGEVNDVVLLGKVGEEKLLRRVETALTQLV